jgi:hypothetical protein
MADVAMYYWITIRPTIPDQGRIPPPGQHVVFYGLSIGAGRDHHVRGKSSCERCVAQARKSTCGTTTSARRGE